jgi:hypothetical protein
MLQVQLLEHREAHPLTLSEVPGVLQPEVAGSRHQCLVSGTLVSDLIATDLVHGPAQVLGDVELVEHQHRLRCPRLDNVGVALPQVTAHALEPRAALLAEEDEECPQGLQTAALATPQQHLGVEVIDVGDVDVAALSRALIN